jgi:glutamate dehydrogenase (NAD(P)+)
MSSTGHQQSFLETVYAYFDRAGQFTKHPKDLLYQIKACNSVYCFQFPIRTERGYAHSGG